MDLLVMRERPRKGIRNSGYDVSHVSLFTGLHQHRDIRSFILKKRSNRRRSIEERCTDAISILFLF